MGQLGCSGSRGGKGKGDYDPKPRHPEFDARRPATPSLDTVDSAGFVLCLFFSFSSSSSLSFFSFSIRTARAQTEEKAQRSKLTDHRSPSPSFHIVFRSSTSFLQHSSTFDLSHSPSPSNYATHLDHAAPAFSLLLPSSLFCFPFFHGPRTSTLPSLTSSPLRHSSLLNGCVNMIPRE